MTLPSNMRTSSTLEKPACAVALYAADPLYNIEIQRAPDDGGAPDIGNVITVAVMPGSTEVFVERAASEDPYWYRIRHTLAGYTESAWTDWISITPQLIARAYRPEPVIPAADERPSFTASTGTLDIAITNEQRRLVSVEFKNKSGSTAEEGSWTEESEVSGLYSYDVDLAIKHPSHIRYKITYYNSYGAQVAKERTVPFGLALQPAKPTITLSMDLDGDITAHLEGDEDTAKFRCAGADDAYPSEAAVDAEDPIAGDSVDTETLVTIDQGETAYVSAKAYTTGEVGSAVAQAKFTAVSEEINDPPVAITLVELSVVVEELIVES